MELHSGVFDTGYKTAISAQIPMLEVNYFLQNLTWKNKYGWLYLGFVLLASDAKVAVSGVEVGVGFEVDSKGSESPGNPQTPQPWSADTSKLLRPFSLH